MITVIDNLIPNFDDYVRRTKLAKFSDVDSQGITYSDMSQDVSHELVFEHIKDIKGFIPENKISFLRAYRDKKDYRHPMWIHSDVLFADYIGIFFIQPSEFVQDDGVAFWRNKELDDIKLYTKDHTEEDNKIVDSQSLDPDKWEMWKRVEFRPNRLVIAPASYFHSKASYGNYGETYNNCRIVHVLFFNEPTGSIDE